MERIKHENIPSLLNHISLYVDSMLETDEDEDCRIYVFYIGVWKNLSN